MSRESESAEMVVREAYEESPGELSSKNPMVLSCGGIYIPAKNRNDRPLWEIINLPDPDRPVTVVSSGMPKSQLMTILEKESMN